VRLKLVVRLCKAPTSSGATHLVCLGGGACSCVAFWPRPCHLPEPLIPSGFESDSDFEPEHSHSASPIRRARIEGALRDADAPGLSRTYDLPIAAMQRRRPGQGRRAGSKAGAATVP
jgi:hypothetical protein